MMLTKRLPCTASFLVFASAVGALSLAGCTPPAETAEAPPVAPARPAASTATAKQLPGMPPPRAGQTYIPGSTLGADGQLPGAATQPTK